MYGCAISIQNPILSVSFSQSSLYFQTDSRHFLLNAAMPYFSMSFLFLSPSVFSTSTSTGSPCVSQPARRGAKNPRMVLYLKTTSLKTRVSKCPMCGTLLAVGGPSKKMNGFLPFLLETDFSKTLFFPQNSKISFSSNIKKV